MNNLKFYISFAIIGAAGVLLHFFYDWSGENLLVGIFSAVNESIWEHLKLLFFPAVLYTVLYGIYKSNLLSSLAPSAIGIYSGMLAITAGYYTYSGILGRDIGWINILLFFIGVYIFLAIRQLLMKNFGKYNGISALIAASVLFLNAILFGIWTFNPPPLGIFIPPIL